MPRRKRRDKGAGSVYKTASGHWIAQIERAPVGGKRRTERRRFATRPQAVAQIAAWQAEAEVAPAARDTVRAWCASWLAAKRDSVTPRTLEFYMRHLGYATTYIGDTRLIDLTPAHVRAVLADLTGQLSDRSRAHIRTVLKSCLHLAVRDGILSRNPVDSVDPPRVTRYPASALSGAERAALLAFAGPRWHALWLIAVDLGPRIGELLAAHVAAFDAGARTLRIYASKTDTYRILPLTDAHVAALVAHRQIVAALREGNDRWQECGLLFPSSVGTPISHRNALRAFKALLRRAGLPPHIRIHDLRHTAATHLIAAGNDLATVQAITGHASTDVLLSIYAHTTTERQREAVERAERRRA